MGRVSAVSHLYYLLHNGGGGGVKLTKLCNPKNKKKILNRSRTRWIALNITLQYFVVDPLLIGIVTTIIILLSE